MSYEAVVLAAGQGNGIRCLIGSSCKALLPVANMPLIYYPVRLLCAHGIAKITLIVLENYKSDVQECIARHFPEASAAGVFDYVELREEDALGTMDALRRYKDRARADNIVVVSGDLVCEADLLRLATDVHDKRMCAATLLLSNRTPAAVAPAETPGGKVKTKPDRDLIGLARQLPGPRPPATSAELAECGYVEGEHRVVYLQGEEDLGKRVPIRLAAMQQFGHSVDFLRCLLDAHLYVLRSDLLRQLCQRAKLSMLKGECLPLVVNELQHADCPAQADLAQLAISDRLSWAAVLDKSDRFIARGGGDAAASAAVHCHVLASSRLCLRVNRLPAYAEATRALRQRVPQQQEQQQQLGDGAVATRSFIGPGCRIGARSRLTDCVIMEGASVGEDCCLINSILCRGAACLAGCTLRSCILEADCSLAAGTEVAGEVVSDADFAT